jgi:hypothetical protein
MKTTNRLKKLSVIVMALMVVSISCSDEFLEIAPTGTVSGDLVATRAGVEGLLIGA